MGKELNAAHRARLIEIVKQRSFQSGAEMKLASGRTSSFYFNMKPTMLHPEGAQLIGQLVCQRLAGENVDMIGGLEMGAVPLASAVTAISSVEGAPLPAFFVRKQLNEGLTNLKNSSTNSLSFKRTACPFDTCEVIR